MHFELMHLDVWFTIPDMEDGKREILQIFIIQKDSTLKLFTKIIRNRLIHWSYKKCLNLMEILR